MTDATSHTHPTHHLAGRHLRDHLSTALAAVLMRRKSTRLTDLSDHLLKDVGIEPHRRLRGWTASPASDAAGRLALTDLQRRMF